MTIPNKLNFNTHPHALEVEEDIQKGRVELMSGNLDVALGYFKSALKSDPLAFEAKHYIADIYVKLKQFDLALTYYDDLRKYTDPISFKKKMQNKYFAVLETLVIKFLCENKNFDPSCPYYQHIIGLNKVKYEKIGKALEQKGELSLALDWYQKGTKFAALEYNCKKNILRVSKVLFEKYIKKYDYAVAILSLDIQLKFTPARKKKQVRYQQYRLFYDAGYYQEGLSQFATDLDDKESYDIRGDLFYACGIYEDSLKYFKAALTSHNVFDNGNRGDLFIWGKMAKVLCAQKKFQAAYNIYYRLINIDIKNFSAYVGAILCLFYLKQKHEALHLIEVVQSLFGENSCIQTPQIMNLFSFIYCLQEQQVKSDILFYKAEEAIADTTPTEKAEFYTIRGELFFSVEKLIDAKQSYEKATQFSPKFWLSLSRKNEIHSTVNDTKVIEPSAAKDFGFNP